MQKKLTPVFTSPFRTCKWLAQKALEKICGAKSLAQLSEYRGNSLWWAIHPDAARGICGKTFVQTKPRPVPRGLKSIGRTLELFNSAATSMIANVILFLQVGKRANADKNGKAMFFGIEKCWREVPSTKTAKREINDFHYHLIFDAIEKSGSGMEIVTVSPLWRCDYWSVIIEALMRAFGQKYLHIPLETAWSWEVHSGQEKARAHFNAVWDKIEKDCATSWVFSPAGDKNAIAIQKAVRHAFKRHFYTIVKNIEMSIALIEREKPSIIVVLNNGGWYWKSIIIAAKMAGVQVLSIQHAMILEDTLTYFYVHPDGLSAGQMPDKTAVYGRWTKDLLMKRWKYPQHCVVVTGPNKYDFLPAKMKSFDRALFCAKHGINAEKKLVFFAAQVSVEPFIGFELPILESLKEIKGVEVVIKPHPRGSSKRYSEIAKGIGLEAVVLSEGAPTIESILASDLVVSTASTVINEAIMADKPVAFIEMPQDYSRLPWPESGVAITISGKGGATKKIASALFDEKVKSKLAMARTGFIAEHLYRMDGGASRRIVGLMEKMIREK